MRFAFSAGGIIFTDGPKLLLIQSLTSDGSLIWHLPKGTIEKGEKIEATAVREIKEETGADVEIVHRLPDIDYFFKSGGDLVKKRVYFFVMKYTGGELTPQPGEVERVEWFEPILARELIAYKSEKELVDKAMSHISRIM